MPNPDLAKYPLDRRVVPLAVARRKDKTFGPAAVGGKQHASRGRSFELRVQRPAWVRSTYAEDDFAVSVQWPDCSSSRKLPLDLRKHPTRRDVAGRREEQGVFVYRRGGAPQDDRQDDRHHLVVVLMERCPANFLWNVVLPNWILVFAAHSVMFMEFYIETGNADNNNNKSLLSAQMEGGGGRGAAGDDGEQVRGAAAAGAAERPSLRGHAGGQVLRAVLPLGPTAGSYLWVAVLLAINTVLYVCVTHWHWHINAAARRRAALLAQAAALARGMTRMPTTQT